MRSLTNPVADGIPSADCRTRYSAGPSPNFIRLPLNMLRINEPGEYKLDKGDVLGIVADEVLTKHDQPIPVQFIQNPNSAKTAVQGLPVPVQDDGKIVLPGLDPLDVRGKTLPQVRDMIVDQIVDEEASSFPKEKGGCSSI